jgi:hypothetical protein
MKNEISEEIDKILDETIYETVTYYGAFKVKFQSSHAPKIKMIAKMKLMKLIYSLIEENDD